jgi:hypothetical protein
MRIDDPAIQARLDNTNPMFRVQYERALGLLAEYPSAIIFPEDFQIYKEIFVCEITEGKSSGMKIQRRISHAFKNRGLIMVDDPVKYRDYERWFDKKQENNRNRKWAVHRRPPVVLPPKPGETGLRWLHEPHEFVQAEHTLESLIQPHLNNSLHTPWVIYEPSPNGLLGNSIFIVDDGERWDSLNGHICKFAPKLILNYMPPEDPANSWNFPKYFEFGDRKDAIRFGADRLLAL